jgi:hypothetical protein
VPVARDNPNPRTHKLNEVGMLDALYRCFRCQAEDVTEVKIEAKSEDARVYRQTTLIRASAVLAQSKWDELKRGS